MNFASAKEHLLNLFERYDFVDNFNKGSVNNIRKRLNLLSNKSEIWVCFPGRKSMHNNHNTIYDYRIDMVKNGNIFSLSHTNIITDIYNKVSNGKMNPSALTDCLVSIAQDKKIDLGIASKNLIYTPTPPTQALINNVKKIHVDVNKSYNEIANSFDLTIEELFMSIKWIALQEDINYPIENGYEGRKMSFYRYLEAIFAAQNINCNRTIEKVILRSLQPIRVTKWDDVCYFNLV